MNNFKTCNCALLLPVNIQIRCSLDEAKRNPGMFPTTKNPDYASLHPGYATDNMNYFSRETRKERKAQFDYCLLK